MESAIRPVVRLTSRQQAIRRAMAVILQRRLARLADRADRRPVGQQCGDSK